MNTATLARLRDYANSRLTESPEGDTLSVKDRALLHVALATSVTALNRDAIDVSITNALSAGATMEQVQEVISLVSGLGVHSLMATAVPLIRAAGREDAPLTPVQQALWDKYVGTDPFWSAFEHELPGFLGAMLRLSVDQFSAFFSYCAVPWKSGQVRAKLKELISMASDATPCHRFVPGFRLHLHNAIALGAGRREIMECLDLAARVPLHDGYDRERQ